MTIQGRLSGAELIRCDYPDCTATVYAERPGPYGHAGHGWETSEPHGRRRDLCPEHKGV